MFLDPMVRQGGEILLPPVHATHAVLHIPGLFEPARLMNGCLRFCHQQRLATCSFHVGGYARLPYHDLLNQLLSRIRSIRYIRPIERLDIIAHSMGGLLALDAINSGALDGIRCRLVTLGTMHRGAWSALPMCLFAKSAKELLPFRKRFRAEPTSRIRCVPLLSIAGTWDLFVPLARCRPVHGTMVAVDADHASLLLKKEVFALACDFLTKRTIIHPPIRTTGSST